MATAESERNGDDAISILTTLHYVTQTQRMGTITEATGRAFMFLTSVSMSLVALGFTGQGSEFSGAFYLFTVALLSVLIVIGWLTFLRSVQLSAEDGQLALEGQRIRSWYVERAPGLRNVMEPTGPIQEGPHAAVPNLMRGQLFLTSRSMIAAVTSALAGVLAGVAATQFWHLDQTSGAVAGGTFAFASFTGAMLVAARMWRRVGKS